MGTSCWLPTVLLVASRPLLEAADLCHHFQLAAVVVVQD
jgi:hypothetical protein